MYTDAPNKRCFSWSNDVQPAVEGTLIVLVTQRIRSKHRAIFLGNIIVPKNYTF